MKLIILAIIFAFSTLLLTTTPVKACEASCQNGISKAFSDAYSIEIDKIYSNYIADLKNSSSLFDGFKAHTTLKKETIDAIVTAVTDQGKSFESGLTDLVKNSIFNEKPQFKGQCQNPLRVTQPPAGVNWTLSDCEKQDYICGNPPAICHFMSTIVKPRIVSDIDNSFSKVVSSDDFLNSISAAIGKVASNEGLSGSDLESYVDHVTDNFKDTIQGFESSFVGEFCKVTDNKKNETACDKYDSDIKLLLLSFP
ncbi:247_t:CDS:1 [Acaulospora colombiana]|uniref:247_t:CDS:1 n=1 Tax=Acaulospora colombiana TaxID=27376 RepID=A0ACA9NFM9_9GLOM|nr:247_t:CDS:1 [Acaulospora colombiana]